MDYRLLMLCYCRILLESYLIKLHSVNIALCTFLCLRWKKTHPMHFLQVFEIIIFFQESCGRCTQLIQVFDIIHRSNLLLLLQRNTRNLPPFSFWLLLFLYYYSLVAQIFELLQNIKIFLSQRNIYNDIKHISIYLTFSGIKSNYNL